MPGVNTVSYKAPSDTFERFIQQDDGTQIWGSGAAAGDVILKRTGAGQVSLTGNLIAGAQGTAPSVVAGTGYSAASITAGSTDTAGQVLFTSTAVGPTNPVATITFGATHSAAPKSVVVWPANINAATNTGKFYIVSSSATNFIMATQTTDSATAQIWNYIVAF